MTTRRYLDQHLRLNQLRALDVVEAQGSVLRAAAALGISRPALTKALHEASRFCNCGCSSDMPVACARPPMTLPTANTAETINSADALHGAAESSA